LGIGFLIWNSWNLLQVDMMFACIVTIGLLGLVFSLILDGLERLCIPWKAR